MKACFSIFCLLVIQQSSWSQPGPEVFFFEKLEILNDSLSRNPENDAARLERINLFYQEDRSMTKFDIDYLLHKFEAGTNSIPLDTFTFHLLYGACYNYSNLPLSLSYYRKAAAIRPTEYLYTNLFNGYYKLRNSDTALLYYDTLIANYGFKFRSSDEDHLTFYKIDLLNSHTAYNPKLTAFYNYLSRTYFDEYKLQSKERGFESNYENQVLAKSGFDYQFQLCEYYLRWQQYDLAEKTLSNLTNHIGRNALGEPVELYKFNKYYFLLGTILEQKGNPNEAVRNFLYASDYLHYKDTVWSSGLWKKYPDNPEFLVLHAQTLYNKQKEEYWQLKDPGKHILELFHEAKKRRSKNYKIFLARADHFLFLKDYKSALYQVDLAIKSSPNQSISYEAKAAILREAYWNGFIPENELEEQSTKLKKDIDKLFKNVVTSVPEINLTE